MPFARIDRAIAVCQAHLDAVSNADPDKPELENYLVSGLLILMVSQYEGLIRRLFGDRAALCGDADVCQYVRGLLDREFRSPNLNKITEHLAKLGDSYRQAFSGQVLNTDEHLAWDNVITARHTVVHVTGIASITFSELSQDFYPKTRQVIAALTAALGLP